MLWVRILCKPVFFFSSSSNYCTYNNKVQFLPKYMYIIITIKVHVHVYITTCRRQIHKVPAKEVV